MDENGMIDLSNLIFRIGEITKITGVSARQLRYWDQKGYIQSVRVDENASRVYSFYSLLKISAIKKFLDAGYTLNTAILKTNQQKDHLRKLHSFFSKSYHGMEVIDGIEMIDLGYLNPPKHQRLYGYLDSDDNLKYVIKIKEK